LKKTVIDVAAAIEAVASGNIERVRELGPPLTIVSEISRAMICAPPDRTLIGADFSAIENRVLAWIAGEQWKLDAFRRFDETDDSAFEPYCVTASRILGRTVDSNDEAGRKLGKICELAFGYGGTLGAWRRFDTTHSDAAVKQFCADWRRVHKATQFFWRALENGLHDTLRTRQPNKLRSLAFAVEDGTLYLTLPSGRRLAYPEARIEAGEHGPQIVFKDNAQGRWKDCRGWFGVFIENVVQAISRDILAAAMQRVEAAGFSVVLHVHDEIVAEVPDGSVEEFERLVTTLPEWATGLPIAAKPWTSARYVKAAAPAPKPAAPQPPPAKASTPQTSFARRDKIHCPFHDDSTPSLQVYADHYHCFGCGAHGDLVDWLVKVEGMNILDAEKAAADYTPAPPASNGNDNQYLPAALRLWGEAQPITDTLAESYLADIRGIDIAALPPEVDLRFHPRCRFNGAPAPCLLVLLRDALTDAPTGIHRIALTPEVFAGGKVERRLLGRQGRGVAKLWPAGSELVVGEGIETVLAAATRVRHHGAPLQPAWAAISAKPLEKLPVIPGVGRLVILVDHDDAGKTAAAGCAERWRCAGRNVARLMPHRSGDDFNDVVLAGEQS
jgi:hypothetical protein